MNSLDKCPRCGAVMEEGFVLDESHGRLLVSSWVAGRPEKSFWFGTRVGGREKHKIRSYRCTGCGFLESYAPKS